MYRLSECPGSLTLTNLLRERGQLYQLRDRAVSSGNRIHAWLAQEALANDPLVALDQDEEQIAKMCASLRDERREQWLAPTLEQEVFVEQRFWYRSGFLPRFSGQPDYLVIDQDAKCAWVADYKTGRREAQEAADNLQLRAEVVLLKHNFPELEQISASIIEPLVSWDNVSVVYEGADLVSAEANILEIVARTEFEREHRVAGPFCVYCPAKAHCREAFAYAQSVPSVAPEKAIAELPRGVNGVRLWERAKVAKKLIETIEEAYTQILETEPEALPGYILPKEGRTRRFVPYPAKFKAALADYLTGEEIDGCANYHLSRIEELFGLKTKLSGKELQSTFKAVVNDTVSTTRDAPFIRAKTKREREEAPQLK
jgi:hypothetical protein